MPLKGRVRSLLNLPEYLTSGCKTLKHTAFQKAAIVFL